MGLQTGRGGETIRKLIVKLADGAGSRQTTGRICQRNIERSPFSAWVHFAFAAAEGARRATGSAAIGAHREAHRERLTVRGHLLRGNIPPMPRHSRPMPRHNAQESSDRAAGAAVRAAVFGGATLAHPRRTERTFRHRICEKDAPSMRLGRSSSARSARAPCAALFDFFLRQTNAPRARHPGGAGQTAAGSAGEGLILSPGLRREGVPAGVAGATKNKLRRRRMGVISPPRFFSPLFSSRGQDARRARGDAAATASAAETGSRSGMIADSLSSC